MNIDIPENTREDKQKSGEKKAIVDINQLAASFFHDKLIEFGHSVDKTLKRNRIIGYINTKNC